VEMIRHTRVRMVAVDEAHCISEWGQSFRPDYLKGMSIVQLYMARKPQLIIITIVARFVKEVGAERVLCLTATVSNHLEKLRLGSLVRDG
jgi:superfamily II DNA helicase RecQ